MNTNKISKLFCSLMAMLFTAYQTVAQQSWGSFSGPVVVEWLDDGRKMRLVKPFPVY